MDEHDENYELMLEKRESYIKSVKLHVLENNIPMTPWELEEIEMAFEHGFAQGFICGYQSLRSVAREGTH